MASSTNNNSSHDFDMRQSDETWKNFRHIAIGVVVVCIVIVVGMALFIA
jgi:hypothetical protein